MQRPITMTLLLSVAGTIPSLAQPMPPAGARSYYQPQVIAAQPQYAQPYPQQQYVQPQYPQQQYVQPQYPQQQYAQPRYVEPERRSLGGGFIEFIFNGGQTRSGRAASPQPYAPGQQVYVPGQPYGQPGQVIQASLPPQRLAVDPRYLKQVVEYEGHEPPGTIVIN